MQIQVPMAVFDDGKSHKTGAVSIKCLTVCRRLFSLALSR